MRWRAFMVMARVWLGRGAPQGEWKPGYLGDVEADTEQEALELARDTWPIPAACAASKGLHAGLHVENAAEMDSRLGRGDQ